MRKIVFLCFICIFSILQINALPATKISQEIKLYGDVYDSFTRIPLHAKLYLLTQDSMLVDSTTTSIEKMRATYSFSIKKESRKYIIKSVCMGYYDTFITCEVAPKSKKYYSVAPQILMKKRNKEYNAYLEEVTVRATKVQVCYRADTIIYDATAFALPEGSMLDALIRQLPGAKLNENGEIFVNGKKVDYLMLNGKNFFKGKNQIMLENLPYFSVQNIKVYNKEKSELEMAMNPGKKHDFIMDVNLKRKYLRNYLGNAEMGIGTDNRWLTRLFTLLNGERNTIAIFTNNNNINEDTKPSQNGNWAHADMKQGVMTTRRIGANIQSDNKNKTIANTLDINTEWNELSSNKIYNSESFSSAGNIFKNGVSYFGNKEKKASVSGEMNITQKSHTSVTYQVNYEDKKAWESQRDSTFRDAVTNNLLENSLLSHLKTVRLGLSIASYIPIKAIGNH